MALSYTFSVSFKTGCYRHIQISANAPLAVFHEAIAEAFGLADGHMHVFFMNNCAWDNTCGYYCTGFSESKNPATDEVRLCDFKLEKGTQFIYIYDFGNEQRFSVKLLRISEEETTKPVLVRSKGEFFLSDLSVKGEDDEEPERKPAAQGSGKAALVHLYACAAVNLYGFVPLSTLCKIFNSQNEETLETKEAKEVLTANSGEEYLLIEDVLVFPAGNDTPELLAHLQQETEGKPRFVPASRESFLKYLDFYYMDAPEIPEKIKVFFEPLLHSEPRVFSICSEFLQMLRLDYPIRAFLELLPQYGISPETVGQGFTNLVIEAKNNSRIWKNKGFTPPEMARLMGHARSILKKVGRNDPCPCGSGKKYKKCCGSNERNLNGANDGQTEKH